MTLTFRIVLICVSVLNLLYVLIRIRRSKIQIQDSVFWILFSIVLIVLSIVPQLAVWAAQLLAMQTGANFVYLFVIFILIVRSFIMTMKLSQAELKIKALTQKIALEEFEKKEALRSKAGKKTGKYLSINQ